MVAAYGFRKSYVNKKRFLRLFEDQKIKEHTLLEFVDITTDISKKQDIDIPKNVIETVLRKLHNFENSIKFSKKHYTLNSLAKELNTNSAYLSKIINVYKNVNFANYLNNLRIDFAVDELASNKSLRSYTIKAIAEEVGFKNAQSFSSAFYKKTGIYPSYFIKHL
jgi:YesN/AraC family two-component response regulator